MPTAYPRCAAAAAARCRPCRSMTLRVASAAASPARAVPAAMMATNSRFISSCTRLFAAARGSGGGAANLVGTVGAALLTSAAAAAGAAAGCTAGGTAVLSLALPLLPAVLAASGLSSAAVVDLGTTSFVSGRVTVAAPTGAGSAGLNCGGCGTAPAPKLVSSPWIMGTARAKQCEPSIVWRLV